MQPNTRYLLRYDDIDLSFENGVYVVNWLGGGVNDTVSTVELQSVDGSFVSKHHAPERQIIINFRAFNEEQKQFLYGLFTTRKYGVLTYVPNKGEDSNAKQIECLPTNVEPSTSAFPMTVTVTLLCPYPLWKSSEITVRQICGELDLWEFDWEIPLDSTFEFSNTKENTTIFEYQGTIPTGFTVNISLLQATSYLKVVNYYTGEYIHVEMDFPPNSEILVSTETGNKKIMHKLMGDNEYKDITNRLVWGSTYFQIQPGQNRIFMSTANGTVGVNAYINFFTKFGGV